TARAAARSGIPADRPGRCVPAGRCRRRASPGDRLTAARAQHRAVPRRGRARATRRGRRASRERRNRVAHRRGGTSRPEAGRDGPHHRIGHAGRCQQATGHSGMNAPNSRNLRIVRAGEPVPVEAAPARLRTSWTADELMAAEFPPVRWAVPGLIAEGVNLLAGPPKVGKSWLSLGLALSVAAGTPALGSVEVEAGPVLYLALEDTPRRLQSRMRKILDGRRAPHGLTLATTCPPLPEGGAANIA